MATTEQELLAILQRSRAYETELRALLARAEAALPTANLLRLEARLEAAITSANALVTALRRQAAIDDVEGDIDTIDATLTLLAGELGRAAITGDISVLEGSNVATVTKDTWATINITGQASFTNGPLLFGSTPSTEVSALFRFSSGAAFSWRHTGDTVNSDALFLTDGRITVGDHNTILGLRCNGTLQLGAINAPTLAPDASASNGTRLAATYAAQSSTANGTTTGGEATLAGGAASGSGGGQSHTGGAANVRGGNAIGVTGTNTGGDANIDTGAGKTSSGTGRLRGTRSDASTRDTCLAWSSNGSAALLGFYGATPAVKPTVTGTRAMGAATASLLSALSTLGLLTDSSTSGDQSQSTLTGRAAGAGTGAPGELSATQAQTILRDGWSYLAFSGTVPSTGLNRAPHNSILYAVKSNGGTDRSILTFGVEGNDDTVLGVNASGHDLTLRGDVVQLIVGGSGSTTLQYDGGVLRALNASSGAGVTQTVRAKGTTAPSQSGGDLRLEPGRPGSGGTPGVGRLRGNRDDSTFDNCLAWTTSGSAALLGLYGATPVAQPTDIGALTSAAGTADTTDPRTLVDVTTAGLADPAKCNDNFATLATWLNNLRTALRNLGAMA